MFDLIPFENRNSNLFRWLDRFDDDFFKTTENSFSPCRVDIQDLGDRFLLEAELPGFKKEEIKIDLDKDCLTLSAQHAEQQEDKGNYIRRERRTTGLSRSFDVSSIDTDHIGATFENGVLTLTLPKKSAQKPQARRITIE